jgi:ElaB/YqjD/DUF883 family membrane-anchored ribosome-binding protein
MQPHDTSPQNAGPQSPDEIAARLEQDRADLEGSIEGLRDRLSLDVLLDDAFGYAVAHAAPYGRALDNAVRRNPIAAVMVGAGLAWLIFGHKKRTEPKIEGTKFEALSRWEDEGGPVAPLPEPDEDWIGEADRLRDGASTALRRIDERARRGLRPLAETTRDRAKVLTDLAQATRKAMGRGLEDLGAEAADRMLAAREKAYAARIEATRRGTQLIEDHPMVAAAVGMSIGAAVGMALPRSPVEDRIFGEERDRLLEQAQHVLRQEIGNVTRAAVSDRGASDTTGAAFVPS